MNSFNTPLSQNIGQPEKKKSKTNLNKYKKTEVTIPFYQTIRE
jgi:hypothetical protein